MSTWIPFQYRDFYDVPRMIVLRYQGRTILLDCVFDSAVDEYRDTYEVFELGGLPLEALQGSWQGLRARAIKRLGAVQVSAVRFDASTRKQLAAESIPLLEQP